MKYQRTADAISSHVDDEDKGVGKIQTPGGMQKVILINESGLYSLILSCNMPTQKAMEMGLFKIKEGTYINGDGVNVVTKTVKVTGKGQQYFINKFLKGMKEA